MEGHIPPFMRFVDLSYTIKTGSNAGGGGGGICKWVFGKRKGKSGKSTKERTILNGVSGMVCRGEVLGILGPSGSGKSTLLSLLGGRVLEGNITGDIIVNGQSGGISKTVIRKIGLVTQDDVLYPHLTVKETLTFCSLLRLPKTLSRAEKMEVAESVISELGLAKCQHTIIGNGFIRGVSGGERKRVSIGHEILVDPSLLLLDEPTSGLDSTAAHRLVSTLVGLSRKGKAVVASVHQPSSQVFHMFDKVLLLSEGSCIYLGTASDVMNYFNSVLDFMPTISVNPADYMLDLANGVAQVGTNKTTEKTSTNLKQHLISSYNGKIARTNTEFVSRNLRQVDQDTDEKRNYSRISWFTQFVILLHRSIKERRYEAFNVLRVFQVIASAILAGIVWWQSDASNVQDRLGLLFFMTVFWSVLPATNAVFTFPQERAMLIKERSSHMYSLSSYFAARMVGDLPMELILPAIFITMTYWMAGLNHDPVSFLLTLAIMFVYVLVAQGLGLLVGASIMDAKRGSTLLTLIMLGFLLMGGFYVHKIPAWFAWLKYTSLTYYSYQLLINVQYGYKNGKLEQNYGKEWGEELKGEVDPLTSVAALTFMFVGYRLFAYVALRRFKSL